VMTPLMLILTVLLLPRCLTVRGAASSQQVFHHQTHHIPLQPVV